MKLVGMGTLHELRPQRRVGDVTWRAAIGLDIGDDDTIEAVAESEHDSEQTLPTARFPEWVIRRPHGVAGAFLFGEVNRGYYTAGQGEDELDWEPDPDAPSWDADLINDVARWRKR